jgi:hypothetical protein
MRSTWWNDNERGKPKSSEKNLSQYHFVHHKSHWIDPGANPGRRDKRPAINRLSRGTALSTGSKLRLYFGSDISSISDVMIVPLRLGFQNLFMGYTECR